MGRWKRPPLGIPNEPDDDPEDESVSDGMRPWDKISLPPEPWEDSPDTDVLVPAAEVDELRRQLDLERARVESLTADVDALLEALSFTGFVLSGRFWPPHEGWAAGMHRDPDDPCHVGGEAEGCWCCAPFSITARVADLLDPPGPDTVLPDGWREGELPVWTAEEIARAHEQAKEIGRWFNDGGADA